jgi:DNA-binding NarL/FixJ family response regulator
VGGAQGHSWAEFWSRTTTKWSARGLRSILEAHDGWEIVAEAENGRDAITKALGSKPDVAIIDYALPLINGIEVTRQIRARLPDTEILIFTVHDSEVLVRGLLEAGARAYLAKSNANRYLIAAVESLVNRRPFFIGRVSEHLLKSYLAPSPVGGDTLTPRERLHRPSDRRRPQQQRNS